MGLPDHYTALPKAKKTYRYQSTGNSWAVPVVRWIGERLMGGHRLGIRLDSFQSALSGHFVRIAGAQAYYDLGRDIVPLGNGISLNCSAVPEHCTFAGMDRIVSPDAPKDIYISPVGCFGIIRRKNERNLKINARLEEVLLSIASEMSPEEIERKSRVQRRGRFSTPDEAGGARESEEPGLRWAGGRAAGAGDGRRLRKAPPRVRAPAVLKSSRQSPRSGRCWLWHRRWSRHVNSHLSAAPRIFNRRAACQEAEIQKKGTLAACLSFWMGLLKSIFSRT